MARVFLIIGGVLMGALGLLRGAGGVALLARGAALDDRIHAAGATVVAAGVTLVVLGAALVGAAVGVLRHNRLAWLAGILLTLAFVMGGVLNGMALYGKPGTGETIANVAAAAVIIGCLLLGRRALR
jgi:hypothetical protein